MERLSVTNPVGAVPTLEETADAVDGCGCGCRVWALYPGLGGPTGEVSVRQRLGYYYWHGRPLPLERDETGAVFVVLKSLPAWLREAWHRERAAGRIKIPNL